MFCVCANDTREEACNERLGALGDDMAMEILDLAYQNVLHANCPELAFHLAAASVSDIVNAYRRSERPQPASFQASATHQLDSVARCVCIPRVDRDTAPELGEGVAPGELAQDEWSLPLLLALDKFVRA